MILTTPRITTSVKQYSDTVHAGGTDWEKFGRHGTETKSIDN